MRPLRDDSPRFIDKLPFNFLYAGLIHLALPRARIVNLQRHPLDTCYAVYKQLFRDAYPFSYDLTELAQYYVAYDRLMRHWNDVMPGVILTLRYEDVVADIEGSTRSLLQYCGLPWDDACLRFHENRRASTTASAHAGPATALRQFGRQVAPGRAPAATGAANPGTRRHRAGLNPECVPSSSSRRYLALVRLRSARQHNPGR